MYYERNVQRERAWQEGRREGPKFICSVLWLLVFLGAIGGGIGLFWLLIVLVAIGYTIYLFSSREKTPWAQDETVGALFTVGTIWAWRNHQKHRRSRGL